MATDPAPHSPSLMPVGKSENLATASCWECFFFQRALRKGPHFCLLDPILLLRRTCHTVPELSSELPPIVTVSLSMANNVSNKLQAPNNPSHCSSWIPLLRPFTSVPQWESVDGAFVECALWHAFESSGVIWGLKK